MEFRYLSVEAILVQFILMMQVQHVFTFVKFTAACDSELTL